MGGRAILAVVCTEKPKEVLLTPQKGGGSRGESVMRCKRWENHSKWRVRCVWVGARRGRG